MAAYLFPFHPCSCSIHLLLIKSQYKFCLFLLEEYNYFPLSTFSSEGQTSLSLENSVFSSVEQPVVICFLRLSAINWTSSYYYKFSENIPQCLLQGIYPSSYSISAEQQRFLPLYFSHKFTLNTIFQGPSLKDYYCGKIQIKL